MKSEKLLLKWLQWNQKWKWYSNYYNFNGTIYWQTSAKISKQRHTWKLQKVPIQQMLKECIEEKKFEFVAFIYNQCFKK